MTAMAREARVTGMPTFAFSGKLTLPPYTMACSKVMRFAMLPIVMRLPRYSDKYFLFLTDPLQTVRVAIFPS